MEQTEEGVSLWQSPYWAHKRLACRAVLALLGVDHESIVCCP